MTAEQKLAELALKGDMDAYTALGYLLKKTVTEDGCWTLDGKNLNENGYTFFSLPTRRAAGHRLLVEILNEELVPTDMVVDHTCHNKAVANKECSGGLNCKHRACFNPDHMEIVTQKENVNRGNHSFWNRITCPSGHPRTEENTRIDNLNRQFCWECRKHGNKLYKREMRKRKKELA